jgi:ferritin-like metal-binding protein YciE
MATKVGGLQELLVDELKDLLDAEKQLVKALPKIAKSCSDEELANAFRDHVEVTKGQVQRLEQIFEGMGMPARGKPCRGMKGLVEEGQEMIAEQDEPLLDSALVGAGRRVEHYEMAAYDVARNIAQQLGLRDAAQLLQETMREEVTTDKQLAQIGKRLLKEASSRRGQQEEGTEGGSAGGKGNSRGRSAGRSSASAKGRSSANGRAATNTRGAKGGGGGNAGRGRGSARPLTEHDEIRQWAEERGANPACVRGTGGRGDTGMIRIDFPGFSGEKSLQEISWDDWFQKFDENNLALLVQDQGNFNKLVSRESAQRSSQRGTKARAGR